jgi:hypothetical protein
MFIPELQALPIKRIKKNKNRRILCSFTFFRGIQICNPFDLWENPYFAIGEFFNSDIHFQHSINYEKLPGG